MIAKPRKKGSIFSSLLNFDQSIDRLKPKLSCLFYSWSVLWIYCLYSACSLQSFKTQPLWLLWDDFKQNNQVRPGFWESTTHEWEELSSWATDLLTLLILPIASPACTPDKISVDWTGPTLWNLPRNSLQIRCLWCSSGVNLLWMGLGLGLFSLACGVRQGSNPSLTTYTSAQQSGVSSLDKAAGTSPTRLSSWQ